MNENLERPISHWILPVLITLIGAFMAILDSSIVNVALPTIMNVFNTNTSNAQWIVTVYMLTLGVVVPLSGWLGDTLGFKKLYIFSLIVFTVGSLLCSISWNIPSLIAARIVQALGGGMIMPTTMSMIYRMVPKKQIGSAMGIFGIALLIAPALGPTIGGYLVEYINWRWIFTINLPIGIAGTLLSYISLPDFPTKPADKLDIGGALSSATMLFTLLLALSKGSEWGWSSEKTVILFYISAVSLIIFIFFEFTEANPLLDLRIFRNMTFTMANVTLVITTIGLYAGVFYIPLFLQTVRGLGAMETGMLMMPASLVSGISMPIVGKLYDIIGPKPIATIGLISLAFTNFMLHNLDISTPTQTIVMLLILRGLSMSLASAPIQTASLATLTAEEVGRASAISNIISRVSASFGIAVLTTFLNNRTAVHLQSLSDNLTSSNLQLSLFLHNFSGLLAGTQASTYSQSLALITLKTLMSQTAFVRAIDDIFIITSFLTLFGLIPVQFLVKGKSRREQGIGMGE